MNTPEQSKRISIKHHQTEFKKRLLLSSSASKNAHRFRNFQQNRNHSIHPAEYELQWRAYCLENQLSTEEMLLLEQEIQKEIEDGELESDYLKYQQSHQCPFCQELNLQYANNRVTCSNCLIFDLPIMDSNLVELIRKYQQQHKQHCNQYPLIIEHQTLLMLMCEECSFEQILSQ